MKKKSSFKLSIGELIDRIAILNVKIWHTEEALSEAKRTNELIRVGEIAIQIRILNKERSDIREEINLAIAGKNMGSRKINYVGTGRDK